MVVGGDIKQMNRNWRRQLQCDSHVTGIVYLISQQASQREGRDKIEWKSKGGERV